MLQTIKVEIDANGHIHPLEPLPKLPVGRALLTLLETPDQKNTSAQKPDFQPLFGLLKTERSVSLEEMDAIVKQHARNKFHAGD
jgi:hypothetical protein